MPAAADYTDFGGVLQVTGDGIFAVLAAYLGQAAGMTAMNAKIIPSNRRAARSWA
jgi:hypothetical protein